jgi:hypothetical protein
MTSRRTIRTWLVVDAVLVGLLVVLAVASLLGRDEEPGVSSTASPEPSQGATGSVEPTTFQLPSGNIACTMSADGVTCTIASITYPEPVVAGCSGETGHVVVLNAEGFAFDCVNGPAPAVAGNDVPVLEYGSQATAGEYVCRSATDGVTCVDGEGVGFQLARASWSELP